MEVLRNYTLPNLIHMRLIIFYYVLTRPGNRDFSGCYERDNTPKQAIRLPINQRRLHATRAHALAISRQSIQMLHFGYAADMPIRPMLPTEP